MVENHGFLVYFERMDNTLMAAWAKAAATYQRPTRVFADLINKGDRSRPPRPPCSPSPGGLPILVDGKVTGGVRVSGVTGDQDEQCAKASLGIN